MFSGESAVAVCSSIGKHAAVEVVGRELSGALVAALAGAVNVTDGSFYSRHTVHRPP